MMDRKAVQRSKNLHSKNLHVLPQNAGWVVRVEDENTDQISTLTQHEAIERAREIARQQGSEVIIHRPDGRIQERNRFLDFKLSKESYLTDRIVASHDVCHGKPRIVGTRIMVQTILDLVAAGKTEEEIISDEYYPDITVEDVRACVTFASLLIEESEFLDTDDHTSRPLHAAQIFRTAPDVGL
jgi:uncharacterized protein (DUF433 family)